MKNRFDEFLALHHIKELLHVGNVWNAQSAGVYEKLGFKVVATSSAAVAESLGYSDGEDMPFSDYLFVIQRIVASTKAVVTVDLEAGYGRSAAEISSNIRRLYELGVSGINIEDSVIKDGKRSITDAEAFAQKLRQIMDQLKRDEVKIFINLRSDSFLLGLPNALKDALERIPVYQETGVHGLFFPCVTQVSDITKITTLSKLPVNVMCMPQLPSFDELQKAGVKRVSDGNFVNAYLYRELGDVMSRINTENSFASLF
ncbi:isocitrate lyase/phosphoenolpyruvate mutase family protein [Chitinophaga sp. S165]|uniref:isocitrate lyase/PEP mutase family protein n=1 Tax=Chitinophaga sp. S165 TaxID=2135462 RepID=UPI000D71B54F|nr:isocitrate lyase/phosphoenolpyruvate mutase family protein [Chitinophaga sp. S165]PWV47669.1 2-methylisocitrate lyase-like PEP mutase family enzyme [Chitinophaga sp. S165]